MITVGTGYTLPAALSGASAPYSAAISGTGATVTAATHGLDEVTGVTLWETSGGNEIQVQMASGYPLINSTTKDVTWDTGGYTIVSGRIVIEGTVTP